MWLFWGVGSIIEAPSTFLAYRRTYQKIFHFRVLKIFFKKKEIQISEDIPTLLNILFTKNHGPKSNIEIREIIISWPSKTNFEPQKIETTGRNFFQVLGFNSSPFSPNFDRNSMKVVEWRVALKNGIRTKRLDIGTQKLREPQIIANY